MHKGIIPATWAPALLGVLRIIAGLLFLEHGTIKFFHFPGIEDYYVTNFLSLAGAAAVLELVGGSLLILGLFTRVTAFIMSGFMAVAYFMAHMPGSFFPAVNGGELAILFCFVCLYLAAAGPGLFALDNASRRV